MIPYVTLYEVSKGIILYPFDTTLDYEKGPR